MRLIKTRPVFMIVAVLVAAAGAYALTETSLVGAQSSGGSVSVVRVDFVVTTHEKGSASFPEIVEEGSYFIAPDGRTRIEGTQKGVSSVELRNHSDNSWFSLDLDEKHAIGARATVAVGGAPTGDFDVGRSQVRSPLTIQLGTKTVGALTLEGSRRTSNVTMGAVSAIFTSESWMYRFPNARILPLLLEFRHVGFVEITEQRVLAATEVEVPASIFEVPADFTVEAVPMKPPRRWPPG